MVSILQRNIKTKIKNKEKEDFAENALYREVWEDVNNEKTVLFLKKYSKYILSFLGVLVFIIISIQMFNYSKIRHLNKLATIYEKAIENKDLKTLSDMIHDKSSISDIALFQSIIIENNKDKKTTDLENISKNGSSKDSRDLAKLHIAYIRGDSLNGKELEKFLYELHTKKSPYYYSAMLLIAQKYVSENNDAKKNFYLDKIINDKDAPSIISATAESLR